MRNKRTASRHLLLIATFFSFFLSASELFSQASLTGHVFDKQNNPLSYVQVMIEQTSKRNVTNEKNKFQIDNLPKRNYRVIFQLIGYETVNKNVVFANSKETLNLGIEMTPTIIKLKDVLITASRNSELKHEVPQFVSVINPRKIKERNSQQTPELLQKKPRVVVQKTNQGDGSPIMRGLKANKILYLVDSIRLNNSTYRGNNTQYLNTIDSGTLDRVEIVHGPISILYSSNALDGAINLITKSPQLTLNNKHTFDNSASASISTVDETKTSNFNVMTTNSK